MYHYKFKIILSNEDLGTVYLESKEKWPGTDNFQSIPEAHELAEKAMEELKSTRVAYSVIPISHKDFESHTK
jgi:hypothetical protein